MNKVSVRKAFKEFASKHYSKLNLCFFSLLFFILAVGLLLTNNKQLVFVQFTIGFILLIFLYGYFALIAYNRIHMHNNVVPSLFTDFIQIIKEGFKFGIGYISLLLLYCGIPFLLIIYSFKAVNNIAVGLVLFLMLIIFTIFIYVLLPSIFYYFRTLKIIDIFKLKEARNLVMKRRRLFISLFWKLLLLVILLNILTAFLSILCFIIFPIAICIMTNLISQYAYIDKPRTPVNTQIKQQ